MENVRTILQQSQQKKRPAKPRTKKVSGIAAGVRVPKQPAAPARQSANQVADESESESEDEGDMHEDEDPDSDLPAITTDKVGDYASAVRCWASLVRLQLDLHADWDDHDIDERRKWGARMQASGRVWVAAVRRHVNNKIFYFYLHLTFAHLQELTIENGHLASGDDSILEQGNQVGKKVGRTSIYWGGTSVANSTTRILKFNKYKESEDGAEDELKSYEVTKRNNVGVAQQMMVLQHMRSLVENAALQVSARTTSPPRATARATQRSRNGTGATWRRRTS